MLLSHHRGIARTSEEAEGNVEVGGRARLHLEPQPLEAARAGSLTPCGLCQMVGHPGYAPGISPSQAARIAIFLVPGHKCGHDCVGMKWRPVRELLPRPSARQAVALRC